MSPLLSLTDQEIGWIQDQYAELIGQVDDAECDRAIKRIEQLERCKQTSHVYHDFEAAA